MPHLLDLTLGTEFKGNDGETYTVIGNLSEDNKVYVQLEKVENKELKQLLEDNE